MLAFFAIAGFAVLAAVAGIYAFREVGDRLDVVDTRVPPALAAMELSRSTERIIAVAPALLAATDRGRRREIDAALVAEIDVLNTGLADIAAVDPAMSRLPDVPPIVASLTATLAALDDLVARRLDLRERIGVIRGRALDTAEDMRRLLAPWL
ncbi:MAG TPA: guanylyl cyclase, partial [Methylomirabilota bacterium]|nr:guanylyl cyclase [Methylomirabilota bacterium]